MRTPASDDGQAEWLVYLLECADGSTYIGVTTDIQRRLRQHNAGRASRYTRGRLPVKLLGKIPCENHGAALRYEARLKTLDPAGRRRVFGSADHENESSTPGSNFDL